MYESQLSDIITVHVDTLGNIYGISLSTANSQCGSETVANIDPNFNTTVLISHMELGPMYKLPLFF